MYKTIRPNVVLEAARYLSNTELFKLEKVVVSEDWVNTVSRIGTDNTVEIGFFCPPKCMRKEAKKPDRQKNPILTIDSAMRFLYTLNQQQ